MSGKRAISRSDFDQVMRRASELAGEEPGGAEGEFTDVEVLRIGREAGLAERHVRRALTELRTEGGRALRRRSGIHELIAPGEVRGSRVVGRKRAAVRRELDEFLAGGQLLQRVRRRDDLLQYRPAIDWASRVARAASSTSRQHYVAASRLVEARLDDLGDGATQVDILVDPGITGDYRGRAVLGGGIVGLAVGYGTAAAIATLFSMTAAALGGLVAGSAAVFGIAVLAGRGFQRRLREIHLEVEGILDGLETPGGLEPPPPAWRRWVRRHFHGVAREMIGRDR
ncbi:MAG: hypothetical protein OXI71_04260 [Gemmatimonadota bacterium]|nr:hypothetical protein [Gemmatimonadota bacterium]MYD13334.1 hypothetical protein [Gemmatimonadota bacterium]